MLIKQFLDTSADEVVTTDSGVEVASDDDYGVDEKVSSDDKQIVVQMKQFLLLDPDSGVDEVSSADDSCGDEIYQLQWY